MPETHGDGGGSSSVLEMTSAPTPGAAMQVPTPVKPTAPGAIADPTRFGRPCVAGKKSFNL